MRSQAGMMLLTAALAAPLATLPVRAAEPRAQLAATSVEGDAASKKAVVNRYCVSCHNSRLKTGGLTLDTLDFDDIGGQAATWEKVVRKLQAGLMPPAGQPRPDQPTNENLVRWLHAQLDRAAAAHPDPGRTEAFHRLNRAEYQNAIRDLLAVDLDVASVLPADDASYGFDNIAGILKMSPTLLDRYLAAARKITRVAIGGTASGPVGETYRVPPDLPQDDHVEGLPFGTRGGTLIRQTFPQSGEYVIKARLARDTEDNIPRFDEAHELEVTIDGARVGLFEIPGDPDTGVRQDQSMTRVRQDLDAALQVRVPVGAGPHAVGVAFLKKSSAQVDTVYAGAFSPKFLALKQPFQRPFPGGFGNDDTRYLPYLASVTVTGPFNALASNDTPSRRQVFICRPLAAANELPCARQILRSLARRAFRRPVTDADLKPLLAFYDEGRQDGFDSGIELAVQRLLMSPEFLFRVERDPAGVAPNAAYVISDLELASRLSFFLWSSIPDEELLNVASRGQLRKPAILERQVKRMLTDARSRAFVENFTGQWLYLRNLPAVVPDPNLFPDFDESLRQAFRREMELFFESLVKDDRGALELLTADYTFVNDRLAQHYGIPNIKGAQFRRVVLNDDYRRGLLGKGAILAATSYPHRTSPVVRGKWILENLLGTPPPPPPPDVPDLKDTNAPGKGAVDAGAHGPASRQPGLCELSFDDGSAGAVARELRRGRPLADARGIVRGDRYIRGAARRHAIRRRSRTATGVAQSSRSCSSRRSPRS